jgi:UDP-N-acetylmuramoyl-tripeptide--D-alanyl-D-alanine ligase
VVPELKLAELVEGTGGALLRGDPQTTVDSYVIDTRRLQRGGVFFALQGTRTDGHKFLGEAARAGAAAAVVEHEPAEGAEAPAALIRVDNTEAALARCGTWVRKAARDTRWIVITGSNGKTTTKELTAEGLSANRRVHRTPGNFNNHLGVPLTLLAMPQDTEMAVIELATSGPGEIAELTRVTDPDIGLVTNIRPVHMESFQTIDDVAAAKGELFALMREDAVAVINLDDVNVRIQAARHLGPQVTFGQHASADLHLEQIDNRFVPGAALTFRHDDETIRVQLKIGGAHAAHDALAALAVVKACGENVLAAAARMEQVEPGTGRGKVHRLARGIVLVDDSYNSSPPALASVLETMRLSEPRGRRVLVVGDMLELGQMKTALHREVGRRAGTARVQMLVGVGPLSKETTEAAQRAGVGEVQHYADSAVCAEALGDRLGDGDLVLIKGSRGMRMGRVVRALISRLGGEG